MPFTQSDRFYQFHWFEKFAWFPKRCEVSGKRIWLKKGMLGVRMITGPGEPVFIYEWLDRKQFLIEKLKGTLEWDR